jgi:hypothetical protein
MCCARNDTLFREIFSVARLEDPDASRKGRPARALA